MATVEPLRKISDIKKVEIILEKQNYRNLALFDFGINLGLRISDLLNLDVKDVKNKKYIELTEQKTKKKKKILINTKLSLIIKNFTQNRALEEPLFKNSDNERLSRVSAYRIINSACKTANIEVNIGTHTLRKTFGYHHYKKFKDIALLQKIFNHSNPQVTLRYIGIEQDEIYNSYKNFIL